MIRPYSPMFDLLSDRAQPRMFLFTILLVFFSLFSSSRFRSSKRLTPASLTPDNFVDMLFNEQPQHHPDVDHRLAFHDALSYELHVTRTALNNLRAHLANIELLKQLSDNIELPL